MKCGVLMGILVIAGIILLVGCKKEVPDVQEEAAAPVAAEDVREADVQEMPEAEAAEMPACSTNSDCEAGIKCVDRKCQVLSDLYSGSCEQKCTIKDVTLTTSDGELYTVTAGKGGYTKAGAVEWALEDVPAFCDQGSNLAAFIITKRNYGEKISESLVTVMEGETSDVITHPTIDSLQFRLRVSDVGLTCG